MDDARNWSTIDWNELPFLTWPGLRLVESGDGRSTMELSVEDHHRGGGGSAETVNGGIIGYMFDGLLGSAVSSSWDEGVVGQVTVTLNMQFLGPVIAEEKVRGTAEVVRRGRSLVYVEGRVFGEGGEVGAVCTGIYKLFRKRP